MTAIALTRPLLTIPAKLVKLVEDIFKSIHEARMASRTVDELSKLSDRELRDMGIHRSQIPGIAFAAARGENYNG